jgi:hypothetical protein
MSKIHKSSSIGKLRNPPLVEGEQARNPIAVYWKICEEEEEEVQQLALCFESQCTTQNN